MTIKKPLKGKVALVMGVASEDSIAWAIAKELTRQGAKVVLGYQFRFHSRIMQMAPTLHGLIAYERCDVRKPEEVHAFFEKITTPIDIVIHAIAFAPRSAFEARVVETTAEDFTEALLTSAHSLATLMNETHKHMPHGGSVVALTYLGGVRVCAKYKVMGVAKAALEAYVRELAADLGPEGIRVNAISAGPIRTIAASGLPDLDLMLAFNRAVSPMRQDVTQTDVAACAAFLASDGARMITGQTIYVDGGYSIIGVPESVGDLMRGEIALPATTSAEAPRPTAPTAAAAPAAAGSPAPAATAAPQPPAVAPAPVPPAVAPAPPPPAVAPAQVPPAPAVRPPAPSSAPTPEPASRPLASAPPPPGTSLPG